MKKNRPLVFILSLVIVFSVFPATANAALPVRGIDYDFDDINGELTIASNDFWDGWNPTTSAIPADTHGITPSTVKSIVVSGSGVTYIRASAFSNDCGFTALHTVDMSNARELTVIMYDSFEGTGITSLQLPPKLQTIEDDAFRGTDITSLQLPSTLKDINDNAFESCNYLTGIITIPESVRHIGKSAFPRGNQVTLKFQNATPPSMPMGIIVDNGEATILYPFSAKNAYTNPTPSGITGFLNIFPFLDTNNIVGEEDITLPEGYESTSFNYDLLSDEIAGFDSILTAISPSSASGSFIWSGADNTLRIAKGLGVGAYELTVQQVDAYGSQVDLIINVMVTDEGSANAATSNGATPNTGDSFPIGILMLLILLSVTVFLIRRKALRTKDF